MMLRRRLYQGALLANAVLVGLAATSFRLGAQGSHPAQTPSDKAPPAVAIPDGLGRIPSPPLQVPGPNLQAPAALAPKPLPAVAPAPAADPKEKLKRDIWDAIRGSTAQTAGIVVEVQGLGRLLEANAKEMLIPASAQKLRTAGVALLKLGPMFQFRTEVLGGGQTAPDGVFRGDLVLVGGGDPALSRENLAALAASLHQTGMRALEGTLWGDESRYDSVRSGPGWKPRYVPRESGPLSALAVDRNAHRKDSSFLADPVTANVDLFRQALEAAGVAVNGPTMAGRPGRELQSLASHLSPPLSSLVATMVKESDNFFAEMILKELGRSAGKPTTQGGAEVVQSTARQLGVSAGQVHDGSGLSWLNRQSAADDVTWLKAMDGQVVGPLLRSSLAVSCVAPGTLKKRFCGTSSAGQVFGKTGALPGSAVLVGYTTTASGRAVGFSFVLAGNQSNRSAREAIDRAVMAIRDFQG